MFLSGGWVSLLLCVRKASLAAAAVPPLPISLSGSSLAAAPLQLPDNSTQSSNNNGTQDQQDLLQLLNSNQTSATYVEFPEASLEAH